jgi:hypothetical protein
MMPFFDHRPRPAPAAPVPAYLPPADAYGNHWLGTRPAGAPAVLKAGNTPALRRLGAPADTERWFVTLPGDRAVLTEGGRVRYFDTPEQALAALREACA